MSVVSARFLLCEVTVFSRSIVFVTESLNPAHLLEGRIANNLWTNVKSTPAINKYLEEKLWDYANILFFLNVSPAIFSIYHSGSCLQQLLLWQWWCSKGYLLFQAGSFKMMALTSFVYWFVNFPELVKPAGFTLHPACPLYVLNEPLYNWAELSRFYWRMIKIASGLTGSGFTQCGPTGCMSVTWELFEMRLASPTPVLSSQKF